MKTRRELRGFRIPVLLSTDEETEAREMGVQLSAQLDWKQNGSFQMPAHLTAAQIQDKFAS
jgi:hypothetical protein